MQKFAYLLLRLSVVVSTIFFVTDCGNSFPPFGGSSGNVSPTLSSLYTNILSQSCFNCHNPVNASTSGGGSGLDFTNQSTSYNTLHGGASGTSSPNCHGAPIVVGSYPAQSYLMAVISTGYATSNFDGYTGCTPYALHHSNLGLSSADIQAFTNWVYSGANNN